MEKRETCHLSAGVLTAPGGVGHRRRSWVEDEGGGGGGADDGDRTVLVADGRGGSSPVLVKIVRALTGDRRQRRPHSTAAARGTGGRPTYARQSSVNRVFQIVKEGLDGVS